MNTCRRTRPDKAGRTAASLWKALWHDAREFGVPAAGELDLELASMGTVFSEMYRAKLWMRRAYSDTVPWCIDQRCSRGRFDTLQYLANARISYQEKRACGIGRGTAVGHFKTTMGLWLPNTKGKLP